MEKINKDTITDKTLEYISQKIITDEWKVGEKIPSELDMAETLGVSRMTVHTAIQRLSGLGLLETSNGSGTYVRQFTMRHYFRELFDLSLLPDDYVQLNQFKISLEIGCLQICVMGQQNSDALGKLDELLQQMIKDLESRDYESFVKTDFQFHKHISVMADNNIMALLYDGISSLFHKIYKINMQKSIEKTGSVQRLIEYHQKIVKAIRNHDWQLCYEIMQLGLKHTAEYYS